MDINQLELDLWQSLEAAFQCPETADLRSLCNVLEQALSNRPLAEQLNIVGAVLVQLSEIYAARSDLLISGWKHRYNPVEPTVNLEDCIDLFVQSLSLDMTELFEEPEPVQYPEHRKQKSSQADGSVVKEMSKDTLLNWVDQMAIEQPLTELQMAEQIRDLAHGENIESWSNAIAQHLQTLNSKIRLLDLQRALEMPLVELWLGLLMGNYSLEQQGEFYDPRTLWINKSKEKGEIDE